VERCGIDSPGSGYGPVEGSCEHGNEPSGSRGGGDSLTSSVTTGFSRTTLFHGVS
jgi:hypothetical protein